MGLRNGQWPKQDANLGHEIWAPAAGFHEIWIVGWLASARENGMRAAVRLGFGERVPCKPQGGPLFSSFAASFITACFSGTGKRKSFERLTREQGWLARVSGQRCYLGPKGRQGNLKDCGRHLLSERKQRPCVSPEQRPNASSPRQPQRSLTNMNISVSVSLIGCPLNGGVLACVPSLPTGPSSASRGPETCRTDALRGVHLASIGSSLSFLLTALPAFFFLAIWQKENAEKVSVLSVSPCGPGPPRAKHTAER